MQLLEKIEILPVQLLEKIEILPVQQQTAITLSLSNFSPTPEHGIFQANYFEIILKNFTGKVHALKRGFFVVHLLHVQMYGKLHRLIRATFLKKCGYFCCLGPSANFDI